jgi:hypothetical protein
MAPFEHKFAESYSVEYAAEPTGGLKATELVIVANIALENGLPGYNSPNVTLLHNAAVAYAKKRGIPLVKIKSI